MNAGDKVRIALPFGGAALEGTVLEPPASDPKSPKHRVVSVDVGNGRTVLVPLAVIVAEGEAAPVPVARVALVPSVFMAPRDPEKILAAQGVMAAQTAAAKAAIEQAEADKAAAAANND
jgi:hypothetical protein